jgi:hypothetical protein
MLSQKLLASICEDVGLIYQMSCDSDSQTVIASDLFKKTARKIRTEHPELDDTEILSVMIKVYSEILRDQ